MQDKDAFTDKGFYSQKLVHTDAFTYRHFYTDTFTRRHVYTQTLLHTETFTRTETFAHRRFYTQRLLHTQTLFTHRRFYTQTLLHTETFTHTHTETLLHTDTFTHGGNRGYWHYWPCRPKVIIDSIGRRSLDTYTLYRACMCRWGGVVKPHFHVNRKRKQMISPETSMYKHVMRAMCFGPRLTKVVCHLPKKKYKRADLAGGECFWADARR